MKIYSTADRLRQLMDERGLKQIDILRAAEPYCKRFGVKLNKNDLSQYVSGKVEPGQDKLSILGYALGVSEAWLMGYNVPIDDQDNGTLPNNVYPLETKRFKMLGEIACGEPIFCSEETELYVVAGANVCADFALRAKGDSMIGARIYDGDIVFIREQPMVENGEIAAVLIGDEATLKRVTYDKEAGVLMLYPENPQYKTLRYSGDELNTISILDKAVAFQSDIR